MLKTIVFVLAASALFAAPAQAQTQPAPATTAPSAEPSAQPAPAKTAMKKKAAHPAKKPIRHAKPKAPAGSQPPAADQD
jgi:hypothetical protein